MRRSTTLVLGLALIVALVLTGVPLTRAAIPDGVPDHSGPIGDTCSRLGGCVWRDALAIWSSRDVAALTIHGVASQTADFVVFENSAGTEKYSVDKDGAVTAAGGFVGDLVGDLAAADITASNGIQATGNVTATRFVGALTGNVTGNVSGALVTASTYISAPTVYVGGVALPGFFTRGRALSVIDGAQITHTVGTTPTACLLTPEYSGGGLTQTLSIESTGALSITVDLEAGDVVTLTAVDWVCFR